MFFQLLQLLQIHLTYPKFQLQTQWLMKSHVQASKRKQRAPANDMKKKAKRQKQKAPSSVPSVALSNDTPAGGFCMVLELGSAAIWDYLPSNDVCTLLETFSSTFSKVFINTVSMKAIENFTVENRTHLGRQCGCDWMRSLDFVPRSEDECSDDSPYTLDKSMMILQVPGGARALLNALVLTERLLMALNTRGGSKFVPLVCPLVTKRSKLCPCTKETVTRAMNAIYRDAGSRYFRGLQTKRGRAILDYLNNHWDRIEDSSCQYCDCLTHPTRNFTAYSLRKFERIRSNCREVYRPLKAGMRKDLQFVCFVPRRRGLHGVLSARGRYYGPYEGLAAGITKDGILCGFYLVDGFQCH